MQSLDSANFSIDISSCLFYKHFNEHLQHSKYVQVIDMKFALKNDNKYEKNKASSLSSKKLILIQYNSALTSCLVEKFHHLFTITNR